VTVQGGAAIAETAKAKPPAAPRRPFRLGVGRWGLGVYTILAFQVFERVYVMTNGGGPNNATITIVQLVYSTAFQFGRYGLASAMAVVLFLMAVAVAVVQFRSLRSDVEY